MAFVLLAGLNVCVFYLTDLSRQVDAVKAGEDAPPAARWVAAVSLFIGVMYLGRMLPFPAALSEN